LTFNKLDGETTFEVADDTTNDLPDGEHRADFGDRFRRKFDA
jgi:hypothetical protein